jgi:hypothetical protein
MSVVAGSVVSFVWSMAAAFILGASRELIFIPALGSTAGNLLEAALMLLATSLGALVVTQWCRVPPRAGDAFG